MFIYFAMFFVFLKIRKLECLYLSRIVHIFTGNKSICIYKSMLYYKRIIFLKATRTSDVNSALPSKKATSPMSFAIHTVFYFEISEAQGGQHLLKNW